MEEGDIGEEIISELKRLGKQLDELKRAFRGLKDEKEGEERSDS